MKKSSLQQILCRKSDSELTELAKNCCIKDYSKMNSTELVDSIFYSLMDMDRLSKLLLELDQDTWDLFQSAAVEEAIPLEYICSSQYKLLTDLCYLEHTELEGVPCVCMPYEVRALFSDLSAGGIVEQKYMLDSM